MPPASRDRVPRLVLAVGVLLGAVYLGYTLAVKPAFAVNFRVYRVAARAALAGESFYGVVPAGLSEGYTYLYPPATVFAFLPFAPLAAEIGYLLFTALNVAVGLALARLLVGYVDAHRERSLPTLDRALVAAFVLGSSLSLPSLVYGNVNLVLALLSAVGFLALERVDAGRGGARAERLAGAALALVGLVKVFPALFGLWPLRQRRARAVTAALATGVAALVIGALVFGVDAHAEYATRVLLPRLERNAFVGGLDPGAPYVTVRRPLSVLGVPPPLLTPLAAALLATPLAALYRGPLDREGRLFAVLGTVVAAVAFVPSYPLYLAFGYFPLVPLLYLLDPSPARALLSWGTVAMTLAVQFDDVARLAGTVGAPPSTVAALRPALSVATPPLVGVALVLAAGAVYGRRTADSAADCG